MKILTEKEEREHNRAVWEGGLAGGVAGAALGSLGVWFGSKRSATFRSLSIPFRAFIITGSTTFSAVIAADRYSRTFERARHADYGFKNKSETDEAELQKSRTTSERAKAWVSEQRYPIVVGSWVASMGVAFGLVSRNKFLTGQQKLVQARVYAQGLTLAVLIASFALESNDLRAGKGRWETIKVLDENDPEHKKIIEKRIHHESYTGEDQWMDMIDTEERRMKEKGLSVRAGAAKKKAEDKAEPKH